MSNKADKRGLVPKLRFPEFRGVGGWERKLLGSSIEEFREKSAVQDEFEVLTSARNGLVRQREYFDNDRIAERDNIGFNIVPPNYLTYRSRSDDRRFYFNENNLGITGIISTYYPVFRVLEGSNMFFVELLARYSTIVGKHSVGTSQTVLSLNELRRIKLPIPKEAEQKKIADCLASIDELITLEAQKLDTLKTHKKGLMQQLFPAEGETLPKLRFPEFRNEGEWVEKQIGDLKPFVTSGSRGWAAYYANQGSLFVRITNLTRDSIYLDLTDTKLVKLPQEANEGVRTQLKEFDVLISITADIGIIGYVDASVPSPAYINQHIALVRFDASQVCSKFVSYFLASERSQRLFRASTDSGTKAGMSLIVVQTIKVALSTLPEQQKIADCLASLDDLITAQTKKLAALKTHKKGLMQQLFPALDEVAV